jgi:hypothetical protein
MPDAERHVGAFVLVCGTMKVTAGAGIGKFARGIKLKSCSACRPVGRSLPIINLRGYGSRASLEKEGRNPVTKVEFISSVCISTTNVCVSLRTGEDPQGPGTAVGVG